MASGTATLGSLKRQTFIPTPGSRRRDHRFNTTMAFAMAAGVFAGFTPTYFGKVYFDTPVIPSSVHVHGAVFTAWILFYLLQNLLAMVKYSGENLTFWGPWHWYGYVEYHKIYYAVAAMWRFNLVFSSIWLHYFEFGPIEKAWRSLTYWKRQPMRIPAVL
jgi:hypothetical protein